jgi:NitT/TauT family transport system ATP-binding protein
MPNRSSAVELRGVSKRFSPTSPPLFDHFSFQAAQGQSVAIVGPSGSGKSTLLNFMALVDAPDAGEVGIGGQWLGLADVGVPRMAYIFQRDALLPWATVMENILLGARCRKLDMNAVRARAEILLEEVGLASAKHRYPGSLSGGQRQLVAIIQNFVLEPDVLLLDEPFAHLDFESKIRLERELLRVARASNQQRSKPVSLILVTHDISEAVVLADRIVVVSGYPRRPTQVMADIPVVVAEADRDPVLLRESPAMPGYFRQAWDAMRMEPADA